MSAVKQRSTFTLSPEVHRRLSAVVPKYKRSQFVEEAISARLRHMAIEEAIQAIDRIKPVPSHGVPTEEALREIRARESKP